MSWLRTRFLAYGVILGTAGVKILSSDDAKKVYTSVTAAALRCADEVMKTAQNIRENCGDIAEDARVINEERAKAKEEKLIADAKALLASKEENAE
ncbi:MAG: hypothetical protein IJ225_02850 [Solobacterium sp.]|nr:hypothetical protein [Solobacterium sp.]